MPALRFAQADLDAYCKAIFDDYDKMNTHRSYGTVFVSADVFKVTYEIGNTYVKVITKNHSSTSVHSFVVNKDNAKFRVGDVLKAASWKAPATNFVRGRVDILPHEARLVRWTGAM